MWLPKQRLPGDPCPPGVTAPDSEALPRPGPRQTPQYPVPGCTQRSRDIPTGRLHAAPAFGFLWSPHSSATAAPSPGCKQGQWEADRGQGLARRNLHPLFIFPLAHLGSLGGTRNPPRDGWPGLRRWSAVSRAFRCTVLATTLLPQHGASCPVNMLFPLPALLLLPSTDQLILGG